MKRLIPLIFFIIGSTGISRAQALKDLASQMQPGTWAELNTVGFGPELLENGGSGSILGFSDSAMWDPIARKFYFMGSPHCGGAGNCQKFIQYDEATNTWTSCASGNCNATTLNDLGHSYEHNTLDPASRTWYHRWYGSKRVQKFNLATNGPWVDIASANLVYAQVAGALAWFPDLYSGGGGLVLCNIGEVHLWNKSQDKWTQIATGLPMGKYHNFAEYNPVHRVVVFGGGNDSSDLYKVDANGVITMLRRAPTPLGIHMTVFSVDPVSGDYLVLTDDARFFKYDVITDTWTLLPFPSILYPAFINYQGIITGIVATPINNYGVVMFVKYYFAQSKVYLYKHGGSGGPPEPPPPGPPSPDTTPPSVPTGLVATSVSASQINLSWGPSTDNVGVAGYTIFRNGTSIATTSSTSYVNTGLTPSTTYLYTVSAFDAAGNSSAQSSPVSATTQSGTPDTIPPVISAVTASVISSSSAVIAWTTNEAADSQIEYGPTTAYGFQTTLNASLVTSHSQSLSGLAPGSLYHYRVKSRDAAGNLATSGDLTLTTGTGNSLTFAEKCAQPGVINCFSLDSSSSLYYTWEKGTVCDGAFAGQTWYPLGSDRSGPGNTAATVQNGQCVVPAIDTSVTHSGTGSLKFTIPSNSSANTSGYYTEPFKRQSDGTFGYIGPGSPLGNVFYFQFYQRFDPNFLNTFFQCLSGETCGGWKQVIWYGNPPNGASASSIESTSNNGWQKGIPTMYGQVGLDGYGWQDVRGCTYNFNGQHTYTEPPCIRYKANQWMEFTGRIEIRGASNAPESRVQLWVDGELAIDYGKAKVDWAGSVGKGYGQFQFTPYHTKKDPAQVHATGYTWIDDIIISTQPIPMGAGSTTEPPNGTPPAAPTNLRIAP